MAMRLTDTDKWNKTWFWKLSVKNKVLWQYLLDFCDNAGFIEIDADKVSHDIKTKYTLEEIEDHWRAGKHPLDMGKTQ